MSQDSNNLDMGENEPNQPGPSNNRTFILVAGIIGALVVLVLIILAIYALVILPRNKQITQDQINARIQANTATVAALTKAAQTAIANANTPTLPPAKTTTVPTATATSKPSSTPVVAQATSTNTPVPPNKEVDPRTATVSALLTQAAQAKLTSTLATSTALPKTGFAEDAGLPGLIGVAILMVVVIFLVRRMRTTPTA